MQKESSYSMDNVASQITIETPVSFSPQDGLTLGID